MFQKTGNDCKRKRDTETELRMELLKVDIEKGKLEIRLLEKQIRNFDLQNTVLEMDIQKKGRNKKRKLTEESSKKPTSENSESEVPPAESNIIQEAFNAPMVNDILGDDEGGDVTFFQDPQNPMVWHFSKN